MSEVEDKISKSIQDLKDEDKDLRRKAALELGIIGSEQAIDPLVEVLKDKEWSVRRNAAWALGRIGNRRASKKNMH